MSTVFYSWQSDLPGNTNRNFIEDALDKALKALQKDPGVYQPPREVDKDTAGVAGSPHIAETIFDKIDAASACVFDVSIGLRSDPTAGRARASPNPNVLVELGYALKAHPDARVIMVMSAQTGRPEELPFDLRFRRVLQYDPVEIDGTRSAAKAELVKDLVAAFKATFAHNEAHRYTWEEAEFFIVLYNNARAFLNLRAEFKDRQIRPYSEMFRSECACVAGGLRELANVDAAHARPDTLALMEKVCEGLDEIVSIGQVLTRGSYDGYVATIERTANDASGLLDAAKAGVRQRIGVEDFAAAKRQVARGVLSEFERFKAAVAKKDATHFKSIRQRLESVGIEVLRVAANLEIMDDEDAKALRAAGHVLHVAASEQNQEIGFREEEELVRRLGSVLEPLNKLTKAAGK